MKSAGITQYTNFNLKSIAVWVSCYLAALLPWMFRARGSLSQDLCSVESSQVLASHVTT